MNKLLTLMMLSVALNVNAGLTDLESRPADDAVVNLLANGSFDEDIETTSNEKVSWGSKSGNNTTPIPSWDYAPLDKWNGVIQLNKNSKSTTDPFLADVSDNPYHLRLHSCATNGYSDLWVAQKVDGLTVGKEYSIDLYVRSYYQSNVNASVPLRNIVIYPIEEGNTLKNGKVVISTKETDGKDVYADPIFSDNRVGDHNVRTFKYYQATFVATTPSVYVRLAASCNTGQTSQPHDAWAQFDAVRLYTLDTRSDANLKFDIDKTEVAIGGEFKQPILTKDTTSEVTYSSSDPEVASVDASTGEITPLKAGVTTIKAESPESDDYHAGEASYELTVKAAIATGISDIGMDESGETPVYYNLQGVRISNIQDVKGPVIVRCGDVTKLIIL